MAQSCPRVYAHKGAIMPTRICTQRRGHAHAFMHTKVRSCLRVCTQRRDHAHANMHTKARSCPHVHVCAHSLASRTSIDLHSLRSFDLPLSSCTCFMYTWARSCPISMYVHISALYQRLYVCIHKCDHAHTCKDVHISANMPTRVCMCT